MIRLRAVPSRALAGAEPSTGRRFITEDGTSPADALISHREAGRDSATNRFAPDPVACSPMGRFAPLASREWVMEPTGVSVERPHREGVHPGRQFRTVPRTSPREHVTAVGLNGAAASGAAGAFRSL